MRYNYYGIRSSSPNLPLALRVWVLFLNHNQAVIRISKIIKNHHVLAVHDARDTARFFVEKLGFKVSAEPDGWVFVSKDDCTIMLGECPDDIHPSDLGSHSYFAYLRVDDVDGYYAELEANGVALPSPPADKPWGMREFPVRTPEGHRLTIGEIIQN